MNRTTVMLPADLKARAMRYTREKGISFGELVRESMACYLDSSKRGAMSALDALFSDTEVYPGKVPSDTSQRHDRYLYDPDAP